MIIKPSEWHQFCNLIYQKVMVSGNFFMSTCDLKSSIRLAVSEGDVDFRCPSQLNRDSFWFIEIRIGVLKKPLPHYWPDLQICFLGLVFFANFSINVRNSASHSNWTASAFSVINMNFNRCKSAYFYPLNVDQERITLERSGFYGK